MGREYLILDNDAELRGIVSMVVEIRTKKKKNIFTGFISALKEK